MTGAEYASAVPLALEHPNVLVSRTVVVIATKMDMRGHQVGVGRVHDAVEK